MNFHICFNFQLTFNEVLRPNTPSCMTCILYACGLEWFCYVVSNTGGMPTIQYSAQRAWQGEVIHHTDGVGDGVRHT